MLPGSASELFGGFDVAPSGMGAYDAYPGFKDGFAVGHVLPPAAHAHAGTPDGAVGKSLADVFTTPGDFAGGNPFAPSLLPLGGNGNPFALPLMEGGKLPGPGGPDAAGIAPHAMLNLGEPPVFTPGGGVKGATAEDERRGAGGPSAGARQVDADASAAPGLGGSRCRRAPQLGGRVPGLARVARVARVRVQAEPPVVANKNKTPLHGAARREAREKSEATEQARAAVAATSPVPADAASPPAAAEENAPGALNKSWPPTRTPPLPTACTRLFCRRTAGCCPCSARARATAPPQGCSAARRRRDGRLGVGSRLARRALRRAAHGRINKAPTPATVMGGGEMGSVAPATAAAHADAAAYPPRRSRHRQPRHRRRVGAHRRRRRKAIVWRLARAPPRA